MFSRSKCQHLLPSHMRRIGIDTNGTWEKGHRSPMRRYFEGVLTCTIQHSVACHILSERRVCGPTYQKHVNGNTYIKLLRGKTRVPHFRFTIPFSRLSCGAVGLGKLSLGLMKETVSKIPLFQLCK